MKTQPKAIATKTIDMLILDTLVSDGPKTARELSKIWGEDTARVLDWLNKFQRLGITRMAGPKGFNAAPSWRADKLLASGYLAARDIAGQSS